MNSLFNFEKKTKFLLLAFLLVLVVFVVFFFRSFFLQQGLFSRRAITDSVSSKVVGLRPEERKAMSEKMYSNMLSFSSVRAASKEVAFSIREPKYPLLKDKLLKVYVTPDSKKEEREVYLIYEEDVNPLVILERKAVPPVDYEALYREMIEWKENGYAKNDANPQLIELKGVKGLTVQPGFNFIGDQKFLRPGWIGITFEGIQCLVVGLLVIVMRSLLLWKN